MGERDPRSAPRTRAAGNCSRFSRAREGWRKRDAEPIRAQVAGDRGASQRRVAARGAFAPPAHPPLASAVPRGKCVRKSAQQACLELVTLANPGGVRKKGPPDVLVGAKSDAARRSRRQTSPSTHSASARVSCGAHRRTGHPEPACPLPSKAEGTVGRPPTSGACWSPSRALLPVDFSKNARTPFLAGAFPWSQSPGSRGGVRGACGDGARGGWFRDRRRMSRARRERQASLALGPPSSVRNPPTKV